MLFGGALNSGSKRRRKSKDFFVTLFNSAVQLRGSWLHAVSCSSLRNGLFFLETSAKTGQYQPLLLNLCPRAVHFSLKPAIIECPRPRGQNVGSAFMDTATRRWCCCKEVLGLMRTVRSVLKRRYAGASDCWDSQLRLRAHAQFEIVLEVFFLRQTRSTRTCKRGCLICSRTRHKSVHPAAAFSRATRGRRPTRH